MRNRRFGGGAAGRSGQRTPAVLMALTALTALPTDRLAAQWTFHASLGARYGTPLVRDSIVNPVELRQGIGLTLGGGVATPVQDGWSGEGAIDVTFGGIRRAESGETVDLGDVTTIGFSVAVRRELRSGLTARAGAGALYYLPGEKRGVFAAGANDATPIGLAAISYAPPWGARYRLALDLRYDVHRFLTPALRSVGFTSGRVVHRVGLTVRTGFGGPR